MTTRLPWGSRALCAGALLLACAPAYAHGVAGARFFPATLTIDDPAVNDELALPTFARSVDSDGTIEHDISFEYVKTITDRLALSASDTYSHINRVGSGFQNLELSAKYLVALNEEHELLVSAGVEAEVGGTGARAIAERFSTIGPQLYFGKGFGDLPTSLDPLRPFAVTGQIGLGFPTQSRTITVTPDPDGGPSDIDSERNATVLNWGFSLQYSLPYLNQNVRELDAPDILKRMIPLVEVSLETPVANVPMGERRTTGTVNPGAIYQGDTFQVGVEALIPINRESGKHPGFIAQLHFFLDDLFPNSIGRPLFKGDHI